jgi:uncharacterized protein YndB with AHSA1/START domain
MADLSGQRRTDSAAREIAASPKAIYRALCDGEAWAKWLPPKGMTGDIYEFEARPGGTFRMALTYSNVQIQGKTSGGTDVVKGRFLEFVPDQRIAYLVTFESDDPAYAGEMKISWHLSPVPGGTIVSVICEGVPDGIRQEDHDAGLQSSLENLATFVEQ